MCHGPMQVQSFDISAQFSSVRPVRQDLRDTPGEQPEISFQAMLDTPPLYPSSPFRLHSGKLTTTRVRLSSSRCLVLHQLLHVLLHISFLVTRNQLQECIYQAHAVWCCTIVACAASYIFLGHQKPTTRVHLSSSCCLVLQHCCMSCFLYLSWSLETITATLLYR